MILIDYPYHYLYKAIGWKPKTLAQISREVSDVNQSNPFLFFYNMVTLSFDSIRVQSIKRTLVPGDEVESKVVPKRIGELILTNHKHTNEVLTIGGKIVLADVPTRNLFSRAWRKRESTKVGNFRAYEIEFDPNRYDPVIHRLCMGLGEDESRTILLKELELNVVD